MHLIKEIGDDFLSDPYDVIQTPTDVTYKAFDSDDPTKVYLEYCREIGISDMENHEKHIRKLLSEGYVWVMC